MTARKSATRKAPTSNSKASESLGDAKKAVEGLSKASAAAGTSAKKAAGAVEKFVRTVHCPSNPALNVRKGPDSGAEVVGELPDGAEVACRAEKDGWCEVDGGFVKAEFLV